MKEKMKVMVKIDAFLRRVALRIGDRVYTGRCSEKHVVEFDANGKDKAKEFLHKIFDEFDIFPTFDKYVSVANELKNAIGGCF